MTKNKFEKVSFEQFYKDFLKCREELDDADYIKEYAKRIYDDIKLPKRATSGSAGYDFFMPYTLDLKFGKNQIFPTGIKCKIDDGWMLNIYPRSSLGFKHGVALSNTVGIIDSDYYNNEDNEGHIFVKLSNTDSSFNNEIELKEGSAVCQGVFVRFGLTEDDTVIKKRNGGLGSTDEKQ